jgi:hypothetical protein
MKRIITAILLPLSITLATACGGGGNSTVDKLGKLANEMCACKTGECADKVDAQIKELKKTASKPSDSDMKKVGELSQKVQKCWMDAQMAAK